MHVGEMNKPYQVTPVACAAVFASCAAALSFPEQAVKCSHLLTSTCVLYTLDKAALTLSLAKPKYPGADCAPSPPPPKKPLVLLLLLLLLVLT